MSLLENIKRIINPMSDEDDDYDEVFDDQESPFVDERSSRADRGVVESRRGKVVNIHATTQLKDKRTVVVNLESTHKDIARRLIDFLSGVAYAGEGKIKRVAANTYIITPYSVEIQGDLIDELENNFRSFS